MNIETFSDTKGQALVESVILIPTLILIITAVTWFSRVVITKQQLISASRYGTDLIVYTNLNENEIRQEIKNYLSHPWNEGRKLDPAKLSEENIKIRINSFNLPEADFFAILTSGFLRNLENAFWKLANPHNDTSYVDISYKFELPPIFNIFGKDGISIKARSEVLAKTGCRGDIHEIKKQRR